MAGNPSIDIEIEELEPRMVPEVLSSFGLKSLDGTESTLQYQPEVERMQYETRTYASISNIMKTRNDIVMNSINNVR